MASSPTSCSQEYCLKWNNHQTTIINVMDTLLEEESLVDVTLSADGQLIRAHRIILSACSPYFRSLFKSTYMLDKHPVIVLNGVEFENLKSLVEYMYKGEANVPQHMLSSFIQTAETLQVRGLAEGASKQKLEQVAEMNSSPPHLNIPAIPPPLNSFKQETGRNKKSGGMVDSISGGILAARLANMMDGPAAMSEMFDLHGQLALAARQQAALQPPPIKRKKVNSPMKVGSEGLSVKKDIYKNSKLTSKSQNIMSNTLLTAPNNNYESDSDVLKIDEDPDNNRDLITDAKDKKMDDIAADGKENGMDSEEEAMSNKELAERGAVPAVGFINPWTGEEIAGHEDEDSITDGVGPCFPSLDNSLSSLSRLDISATTGDKSPVSVAGNGAADTKDPLTNKYSCQRCGRSYLHQATLVRHQRYECGITASYPCRLCGRKFKRRDVLKGHMEKCMNKSTAAVQLTSSGTSPLVTSSSPLRATSSPLTTPVVSVPSIPQMSPFPGLLH